MIYLVSKAINVDGMADVLHLSVPESIALIKTWPVVQFDTETTGLDPRICCLTSMQFGYKDFHTQESVQIVVDCNSVNPEEYKQTIEQSYLIGHNLKFDLQFLYNYSITPLKVYDTLLCEQVLYLGYPRGKVSFGLGNVLERYTGIHIDKTYQAKIADAGLTPEGIRYAAQDVVYLQDIRKGQIAVAAARNCLNAFTVENRFVPAVAYLEWCGVRLDVDKWKEKMKKDEAQLNHYKEQLDNYVLSSTKLNTKFVTTFSEPSLFDTETAEFKPECTVDWNSPKQVVPVMQELGFNTKVIDKTTKEEKDSALEKLIVTQKGIADDFLEVYYNYKGAAKNVSSYGQNHLNLINPRTGRLHTIFQQIGTVTGRMSSGGSSSNTSLAAAKGLDAKDVKYVNLQNLPARGDEGKVARACFIAKPGNTFISCDYSAEESRVSADVWNEKSLLHAFKEGIDTHNLYAKMCFPEELADVDVKDVKKVRPDLRQAAKSAEFAVNYGSNGASIAATIGMPTEKAIEMVQGIIKGMPGMASFKRKTGEFLKKNGYIVINQQTGHRVYWPEWSEWKAEEDRMDESFWEDYRMNHKGSGDEVCQWVRKHMSKSHDWLNKNVLNYPIQGGSAIVLKQAAADLFEWVIKNKYFGIILFCVFVHDEIDCECPEEMSEKLAKKICYFMERAAAKYYKKLPIPAESSVSNHWVH